MTQPTARYALRDSIRQGAHWSVTVRPSEFVSDRLSLPECWQTVEAANVRLRGWDYPHIDEQRQNGQDFIESWVKFSGERSFWRFYQSGLFFHVFAFREDSYDPVTLFKAEERIRGAPADFRPTGYADFLNVLITATEIVEFASRLAQREALGSHPNIEITMESVRDRLLLSFDVRRLWTYFRRATEDRLSFTWNGSAADLMAGVPEIARQATRHFYERFGWLDAAEDLLIDEQSRFLSGRQ